MTHFVWLLHQWGKTISMFLALLSRIIFLLGDPTWQQGTLAIKFPDSHRLLNALLDLHAKSTMELKESVLASTKMRHVIEQRTICVILVLPVNWINKIIPTNVFLQQRKECFVTIQYHVSLELHVGITLVHDLDLYQSAAQFLLRLINFKIVIEISSKMEDLSLSHLCFFVNPSGLTLFLKNWQMLIRHMFAHLDWLLTILHCKDNLQMTTVLIISLCQAQFTILLQITHEIHSADQIKIIPSIVLNTERMIFI